MKILTILTMIAGVLLVGSIAPNCLASGWVLMAPDFAVTETRVIARPRWIVLESFTTGLECDARRSSLIEGVEIEAAGSLDLPETVKHGKESAK
jgi:hypothetical protein